MICSTRMNTPAGPIEHRTIYSYRGRDSTYVVTALLATGQVWTYHGRPDGNTWVFDLQSDRPEATQRLRMVLTIAGDTIHFDSRIPHKGHSLSGPATALVVMYSPAGMGANLA